MKTRIAILIIAGLAVAGACTLLAQGSKTIWDGVFTDEQAQRGTPLYNQYCASCHGDTLAGGEEAPPLSGGDFQSNWNGLTVGDLFDRIRTTMPLNNPHSLSSPICANILAYILSVNKFPPGKTELPTQTEVLKGIKFLASKP